MTQKISHDTITLSSLTLQLEYHLNKFEILLDRTYSIYHGLEGGTKTSLISHELIVAVEHVQNYGRLCDTLCSQVPDTIHRKDLRNEPDSSLEGYLNQLQQLYSHHYFLLQRANKLLPLVARYTKDDLHETNHHKRESCSLTGNPARMSRPKNYDGLLRTEETLQKENAHEVIQLESDLNDLHAMHTEMKDWVITQESGLHDTKLNIEQTRENVEKGDRVLRKSHASSTIRKKMSYWMGGIVLIVIIVIILLVVMVVR